MVILSISFLSASGWDPAIQLWEICDFFTTKREEKELLIKGCVLNFGLSNFTRWWKLIFNTKKNVLLTAYVVTRINFVSDTVNNHYDINHHTRDKTKKKNTPLWSSIVKPLCDVSKTQQKEIKVLKKKCSR